MTPPNPRRARQMGRLTDIPDISVPVAWVAHQSMDELVGIVRMWVASEASGEIDNGSVLAMRQVETVTDAWVRRREVSAAGAAVHRVALGEAAIGMMESLAGAVRAQNHARRLTTVTPAEGAMLVVGMLEQILNSWEWRKRTMDAERNA